MIRKYGSMNERTVLYMERNSFFCYGLSLFPQKLAICTYAAPLLCLAALLYIVYFSSLEEPRIFLYVTHDVRSVIYRFSWSCE